MSPLPAGRSGAKLAVAQLLWCACRQRIGRKLAAIFATDLAGYTGLLGLDEVQTLRALNSHREIMDALIAENGEDRQHGRR